MGNHWPVLVAVLLIGAAVGYGMFQRDRLEETAQVRSVVVPLPAVYLATAPETANPQHNTAAPSATEALPLNPAQPQAAANVGINVQLPAISPGSARGNAFTALRAALIQKFGVMPLTLQNGGFAISADGVRVEADTGADWSISIYNNNPPAPAVQTDNFKSALNLVVANFDIELTALPNAGADGKQTLRTVSKAGRVSMVTDPMMGNSVVIKPLQKRAPLQSGQAVQAIPPGQAQQAAPKVNGSRPQIQPLSQRPGVPPPPAAPVVPVAPPKPPPVEQF